MVFLFTSALKIVYVNPKWRKKIPLSAAGEAVAASA